MSWTGKPSERFNGLKKILAILILIVLCIFLVKYSGYIRMELIKHTIHSDLPGWLLEFLWGWW